MKLCRAHIKQFRSLRNVSVNFGSHTAFIGGNGAGKSSILKAIERFYSTTKTLDADDYFGRDVTIPIEIELTFSDLTEEEHQTFESRVRDGQLVVTRVFDGTASSGRYYGSVLQNPDFLPIRQITQATAKREAYKALKTENPAYSALPNAASAQAVDDALIAWEAANPASLSLQRDDGQFFGFQNASRGALQRHTTFVFVPAVRDALQDAADGKTTPIGRLLEILVRSSILKRAEVQAFQQEMAARYAALVSPENMPELGQLAEGLTSDLKELYGQAAVGLEWRQAGEIPVPLPAADVTLSDDGFGGPVDRQGHGLQRAFVFTLLQHLARASAPIDDAEADDGELTPPAAPNLILAIEEPELYQHPTKQRHLASVLRRLSTGHLPGATGTTQIAFASHSPMFVSLTNADEIRLVRRVECDDSEFKQCELRSLDLNEIARKLEKVAGKAVGSFSAETLKPRLHILGTELAEGFFADGVVLVEGRSDKAALCAVAQHLNVSFEASGIAVLSAEGKNNLDRPYLIFRELGIPVFLIWDCDCGTNDHKPAANLALTRMMKPEEAVTQADEDTLIAMDFARFHVNLESCLKDALTPELFTSCLAKACEPYGFDASNDAQKIPDVMYGLLSEAKQHGKTCDQLHELVRAIWLHLKGTPIPDATAAHGPTSQMAA